MREASGTAPDKRSKRTMLATSGRSRDWTQGLVNTPVMRASTVLFDSYADLRAGVKNAFKTDAAFYGRMGTPSQWSLRAALTDLEGAHDTLLYPSGIAALAQPILCLVASGDHALFPDSVYEPMRGFARTVLKRLGVTVDYYDPMIGADIKDLIQPNTKVILVESPGSLTFEVQDIPAIAEAAKVSGAFVVADNTWATPLYCNPLALGADVSMQACTKYTVGHSDVMMGAASCNQRAWNAIERSSFLMGQTVSPDDAYLTLRGLRTLEVRLRQHGISGMEIAAWLMDHPMIADVRHPALVKSPGHDLWKRDFTGASGLFSIVLKGGTEPDCAAMVDQMRFFKMGFSWGGFESLVLPADPAGLRTATKWQADGPLLRLHIGLEDTDDLKADLADGLDRYRAHLEGKA